MPSSTPIGAAADQRAAVAFEQFDRLVVQELLGVVGVELVDRGAEFDFADRLIHRLAHLALDDLGELVLAFVVQRRRRDGSGRRARPASTSSTTPGTPRLADASACSICSSVPGRVFLHDVTGRRVHHCIQTHRTAPCP